MIFRSKVVGSNPTSATNHINGLAKKRLSRYFLPGSNMEAGGERMKRSSPETCLFTESIMRLSINQRQRLSQHHRSRRGGFTMGVRLFRGLAEEGTSGLDTSKTITSVCARSSGKRSATSMRSISSAFVGPADPSGREGVGVASLPNQKTR